MDGLRGPWGEEDRFPGVYDLDDGSDAELAPVEPPPVLVGQDERRMQVRAYNLWASLLADRRFPRIADLDIAALPEFGPQAVLLDFSRGVDNPRIGHLGRTLAEECGATGPIRRVADIPGRSLLSRITDHYMQILANEAPIGFEAEFVNRHARTVLYRGILLPFSDDDRSIGHILGVINWKELADQATTDELLLEIDQALRDAPPAPSIPAPVPAVPGGFARRATDAIPTIPTIDARADAPAPLDWPMPAFGAEPSADAALAACLAAARELALLAAAGEDRTRQALYAAIGRAHDVALAVAAAPDAFAALLAEAGIAVQERAPLTGVAKLVFGAGYDKTRLTEVATALGLAQRLGLAAGTLADHLAATPGGLKAVVAAERALRRTAPSPRGTSWPRKLRRLPPVALDALGEGEEFTLLVARRGAGGVVILGEVKGQPKLVERAARELVR